MSENKKMDIEFKDGVVKFGLDMNQDGEKSIEGELYLSEALQEAINRGEPIEGAKVVSMKFEGMKMVLVIDTDRDGQPLFKIKMNLPEVIDEGSGLIKK